MENLFVSLVLPPESVQTCHLTQTNVAVHDLLEDCVVLGAPRTGKNQNLSKLRVVDLPSKDKCKEKDVLSKTTEKMLKTDKYTETFEGLVPPARLW